MAPRTVSGLSPIFSLMRDGNARMYCSPCFDSGASPPILPSTLYCDSPCCDTISEDQLPSHECKETFPVKSETSLWHSPE